MGDTTAAPEGQAPQQTSAPPETGSTQEAAPAPRTYRLKGIDGEEEREYDESTLVGLAQRGKKSQQILSKAEQRAQEALRREKETAEKLNGLKDPKRARQLLRELGVDVRSLSEEEITEAIAEEKLTPEQKRIRELEGERQKLLAERQKEEEERKAQALEAATKKELDNLSNLFLQVVDKAGLPRELAQPIGMRLARVYQVASAAGEEVDPDLAAHHIRSQIEAENRALYWEDDGKGQKRLNFKALEGLFGAEGWKQIQAYGVQRWRQQRTAGAAPPPAAAPVEPATPKPANGTPRGNYWRELEKSFGR